ncbi:hypothetical protein GPECTOR_1g658 [Gonium pectorale]|uniref:RecA family profile 1 domain-containing protein n=1 Tax=Gonium pectorale TaxID=33097 RepID=A0A150H529_GONPE|nr:hypothetical protein GPECTOR_1g658 [Gonium pectorale]|eukprot:KXZ56730.1 hypothetical protein GPECTOR_1g658 [Gonium pectorale]
MRELRNKIQVLPTGCAPIDTLLGGGLREGTVVEVAGETASGKTQLCLSAAATTAFRGEPVFYVDTTGSFAPERVVRMAQAEAAVTPLAGGSVRDGDPGLASRVLGCIHVTRAANVYELLAILDQLQAELQRQQQLQEAARQQLRQHQQLQQPSDDRSGPRLLVVDSVSALLSTVLGNNQHMQGTALLTTVGRTLKLLAEANAIAVLITNHVTSSGPMARGAGGGRDPGGDRSGGLAGGPVAGVSGLKPALGEQWRSQAHMRLQLSLDDSQSSGSGARLATLTASPLQNYEM